MKAEPQPTVLTRGTVIMHVPKACNERQFRNTLSRLRRNWQNWRIVMFVSENALHAARANQHLAQQLGIELRTRPQHPPS